MTGAGIACLSTAGVIVMVIGAFLTQLVVGSTEHKLWPRGLRWFPGWWLDRMESLHRLFLRMFWPEKLAVHKGRKVIRLESYDTQWKLWAGISDGNIPEWVTWGNGDGRWEPRPSVPEPDSEPTGPCMDWE